MMIINLLYFHLLFNNNCELKECRKSDLIIISECVSGQLVELLGICLHIVE